MSKGVSRDFQYDVVGQGVCAVDYLCRLPHYPRLDEKTELMEFSMQGGGPVPTALVALARLGARACYLGKVGDDHEGRFIRQTLEQEGVDVSGLVVSPRSRTTRAFVWIDGPSGLKSIAADRTGLESMRPGEISREQVTAGRYLLIDGKEIEVALTAARWARQAGAEVILDVGSQRTRAEELLGLTDYLIVSESFILQFDGHEDPEAVARDLSRLGPRVVVVTLGHRGSICLSGNELIRQEAFSVPVVDTTGAGDVFHGGFIYGLLQGWDLADIIRFASAAAAIKCGHMGGREGVPSLSQVEEFLARMEGH